MIQDDLSFHFEQPTFAFQDLEFAFQILTIENVYGLDASLTSTTGDGTSLFIDCKGLTWAGGQEHAKGCLRVWLRRQGELITIRATAEQQHPIKVIKTIIYGLPPGEISHLGQIEGGQKEQGRVHLGQGENYLIRLPGWRPDGIVFLHHKCGCTSFASYDEQVRPQRFYFSTRTGRFIVELIFEEDAGRWDEMLETPVWWIQRGTKPEEAIQAYQDWLEKLDDLKPWEKRSDVPDWAREIRLVVNLHGEHWTGYVFNTFEKMIRTLQTLDGWIPSRYLLVYLPGFSGRYYYDFPNYHPGIRLGGAAGFRELVKAARKLGCHLMPMFGAHGCNILQYPRWRAAVVRDRYGRSVYRLNLPDWDSDREGEESQVFLNPGNSEFRNHLVHSISNLLETYELDAACFDTMSWNPNDARVSMWPGVRKMLQDLRGQFPNVLWASEGAHARLMQFFPLVQVQLRPGETWLYPEFVYRYIRTFEHLDMGAPGLGSSGVHEHGFQGFNMPEYKPGHIPALSLVDDTLTRHADIVQRICKWAHTHAP